MFTERLIKDIQSFKNGSNIDQLFYLACLKRVGRIAKVAYRIRPSEEFKQDILNLKLTIEHYQIK